MSSTLSNRRPPQNPCHLTSAERPSAPAAQQTKMAAAASGATISKYSLHAGKNIRHQSVKPDVPAQSINNVLQMVTLLLVRSLPESKGLRESVA